LADEEGAFGLEFEEFRFVEDANFRVQTCSISTIHSLPLEPRELNFIHVHFIHRFFLLVNLILSLLSLGNYKLSLLLRLHHVQRLTHIGQRLEACHCHGLSRNCLAYSLAFVIQDLLDFAFSRATDEKVV